MQVLQRMSCIKNIFSFFSDPVHVQKVEVSNLVFNMLSSLCGLWDIKMSAEFVSTFLIRYNVQCFVTISEHFSSP